MNQLAWPIAEQQIGHWKSSLVLSARFPVVKWLSVLLLNQPKTRGESHSKTFFKVTNVTASQIFSFLFGSRIFFPFGLYACSICLNYRKCVLKIKAIEVLLRHDFIISFHETASSVKTSPKQYILWQGYHARQGARCARRGARFRHLGDLKERWDFLLTTACGRSHLIIINSLPEKRLKFSQILLFLS